LVERNKYKNNSAANRTKPITVLRSILPIHEILRSAKIGVWKVVTVPAFNASLNHLAV
jgi:hypothetical protein